jgi:hypothetical protein
VLAAGAAVAAAGLLPNKPDVPVGVAAPDAGVDVLPNKFPAGFAAPPKMFPPAGALVVWPNIDVPLEGAAVAGVVVAPALPNRLPA